MPIEVSRKVVAKSATEEKKDIPTQVLVATEGNSRDIFNPKSKIPFIEFYVDGERVGGRHISRGEEGEYLSRFYKKYKGRNMRVIVNDPAKPFGYAWYELV